MIASRGAVIAFLVLAGCAKTTDAPLRSPTLDYQQPAVSTAGGDTVGADRQGPGEKLDQGISTSGPAPGWSANKDGLTYDPKQRTGGAIDPPPARGASQK